MTNLTTVTSQHTAKKWAPCPWAVPLLSRQTAAQWLAERPHHPVPTSALELNPKQPLGPKSFALTTQAKTPQGKALLGDVAFVTMGLSAGAGQLAVIRQEGNGMMLGRLEQKGSSGGLYITPASSELPEDAPDKIIQASAIIGAVVETRHELRAADPEEAV